MQNEYVFWPSDLVDNLPVSPLQALNEACSELAQATGGYLEGKIVLDEESSLDDKYNYYDFMIIAKAIGFRFSPFWVKIDPIMLYPVHIRIKDEGIDCEDGETFKEVLQEIFRRKEILTSVKSLIAQAQQF